ncbi:MAG: CpsD/CapB family tyrosine-protein kinase [Oscillospiraceae bacterium]|nr:CpsD/CapB family tyrosine-protein kinase [Oscillospiraceae bacterium]
MSEINISSENEQLTAAAIITIAQDVLRRWYLIVAAAVMAAMMAFVFVDYTYRPVYRTTATFVVSASSTTSTTYTNLSSATNTAAAFTEVFNSSILRRKVLQEMDMPYFDGKITAEVAPDTNLLVMTVTGSDPRSVFLMSKGVIEHHSVVSEKALAGIVMELLDAPDAPVRPINSPDTVNKVVKAALLAAIAVAGVLVALSYLSEKIRSRKEADAKLTCHVLGELYHERKNKTLKGRLTKNRRSILITDPLTSFIYTESVHKLAGRVDRHRHKGEHIIMVTSVLENEGKSTVAANIALSIAKKGKKVLLIDCDLRKPSFNLIFDMPKPAFALSDVLKGKATLAQAVKYLEHKDIYLLPARKSIKTATELLNSKAMENLLMEASQTYDMVIVDVPPMAVASDAENLCEFVDASLLVVRQNMATADRINEAAETLGRSSHLLGCVLNNVYGSGNFAPVYRYGAYSKYGRYGKYGKYGRYGQYGYGKYGRYGSYKSDSSEVKQ